MYEIYLQDSFTPEHFQGHKVYFNELVFEYLDTGLYLFIVPQLQSPLGLSDSESWDSRMARPQEKYNRIITH